jgi:hypothetical protein
MPLHERDLTNQSFADVMVFFEAITLNSNLKRKADPIIEKVKAFV